MTLEEFTAQLNSATFWKEFTYSETWFYPRPKDKVELADGIVLIGPLAFVYQLKERTDATDDPETERRWFNNKVLGKATKQIRDSLGYLADNDSITLRNAQGHTVDVKGPELTDIHKIIIFSAAEALPADCWQTQFYVSNTAGFIHVLAAHDYLGILDKLRVPNDIRLYFEYRQSVLPRLREQGTKVEEPDIMVAFLTERDLPEPGSKERLRAFVQDLDAFDLSPILGDLAAHIQKPNDDNNYYCILLEFARSSRLVWREFKIRLVKALEASRAAEPIKPFRFTWPENDCTFMVTAMDPDWPSTGPDGERMRMGALAMFTAAAKYDAKSTKGVGLLISKDGEHINLDWCLVDGSYEHDSKIENVLSGGDLFRPVSERMVDNFYFRGDLI
ncbi:hypothetical protein [Rhizobium sp. SG570]|uniref:hypothetical protein n=1 Tax=Rhizobium sp. SG570 TaxID=2587113 RepID=UPI001445E340|nr:hypothetical protein [Rhizobium sp. SG570]NKJ38731.1 hypothetical protein [Rhizobium sp. SG570]